MGQAFSFDDAGNSPTKQARATSRRSSNERVTRRRKRPQVPVRVPELDWPGNLFSDNASMAEIMTEDFPQQWELSATSPDRQSAEM